MAQDKIFMVSSVNNKINSLYYFQNHTKNWTYVGKFLDNS